jgi:hypothetical protein
MKEPKAKKANARRGVRVGWEAGHGVSEDERWPRWVAPADLMHDSVWNRGPIVSLLVNDTAIMRPAADARQQVQRRGRQAVREHRCRMRVWRCFAVAKARPTHQQQGLDALQGLAGCARAAGGAPNMFATKLPCLCWQGARIISPGVQQY